MSELTIIGRLERRTCGRRARAPAKADAPARATPRQQEPSRVARMLALAHRVEQLIDDGELADYADAARRLGITRARMSQVIRLARLPVATQEAILLGQTTVSERTLRTQSARNFSGAETRNDFGERP